LAQLIGALRCKLEGRGFDCHWYFSLTYSFRPQYDPGLNSASNRNKHPGYLLGVKTAGEYG